MASFVIFLFRLVMNQISYRITFTGQEVFKFILASCISIFSTRTNKGRSDSQSILQWVLGKVEHTRKKSRVFQLHENCLNVCSEKYLLFCLITVNSTVKLIINHITILSLVASTLVWYQTSVDRLEFDKKLKFETAATLTLVFHVTYSHPWLHRSQVEYKLI